MPAIRTLLPSLAGLAQVVALVPLLWSATLISSAAFASEPETQSRAAMDDPLGTPPTGRCGDQGYDDGTAEDALFFGGGNAGDPDYVFAVMFDVTQFGFDPDEVMLESFCAPNTLDFTNQGGPWPNQLFVVGNTTQTRGRDNTPLENVILAQGTVVTGDGLGNSTVVLAEPVPVPGRFWLMNRGAPQHAGEDFNMETDQDSDSRRRSHISDRGVFFLFPSFQNLMLQVTLSGPRLMIPSLTAFGVLLLMLVLGTAGVLAIGRRSKVSSRSLGL